MALDKEVESKSGLKTLYHRIAKVAINFREQQCIITVESYIDAKFRDKAKQADEVRAKIKELFAQIDKAEDSQIIEAVSNKIQETQFANADILQGNFAACVRDVSLDNIPEDLSLSGLYAELRKLEEYKDATHI